MPHILSLPLLSAEQCEELRMSAAAALPAMSGQYRMRIGFVDMEEWIKPLLQAALDAGGEHYGTAAAPLYEYGPPALRPRVTTYVAPDGHFDWHMDGSHQFGRMPETRPTLSGTVQLVRGDDYRGGNLLVRNVSTGKEEAASRELGHVTIFPSSWWHSVARLQHGMRASFVFWGYGGG